MVSEQPEFKKPKRFEIKTGNPFHLVIILLVVLQVYFPIWNFPWIKGQMILREKDYTEKILKEFPLGSTEQDLIIELENTGFRLWGPTAFRNDREYNGGASYEPLFAINFPCSEEWRILWNAQEGKIQTLKGLHFTTCL